MKEQNQNPFADLIPGQQQTQSNPFGNLAPAQQPMQQQPQQNPFADLAPKPPGFMQQFFTPPPKGESDLHRLVQSPPIQTVLGAGDAIQNFLANINNLVPGGNAPMAKTGEGSSYELGRVLGDIGAFAGGGELAAPALMSAKAAPYVGKLAEALSGQGASGAARRILGGAGYGAITNPDSRGTGTLEGAGFSAAAEALPLPFKAAGKIAEQFKPQKYAEDLMQDLSGGRTLEENTKSLASAITDTFKSKKQEAAKLYQPVFEKLGNESLYDAIPIGMSAYEAMDKTIPLAYTRGLRKAHESFSSNPTLENAHKLQSQLGSEIRDLQKGGLSIADRDTLLGYAEAQTALKDDISKFFQLKNPKLGQEYTEASNYFLSDIVPYLENSKLRKIALGEVTNPKSIANMFKHPEDDMLKVAEDLGEDAKKQILYSELGKHKINLKPERLSKALSEAKEKGLGSYFTDEIENKADTLASRIDWSDKLKRLGGLFVGSQAIPGADLAGAAMGAVAAPSVTRAAMPLSDLGSTIAELIKRNYPLAKKSILGSVIPGGS